MPLKQRIFQQYFNHHINFYGLRKRYAMFRLCGIDEKYKRSNSQNILQIRPLALRLIPRKGHQSVFLRMLRVHQFRHR